LNTKRIFFALWPVDVRFIPDLMQSAQAITFDPFRLRLDKLEFWPRPKIAAMVPPRVPPDLENLVGRLHGLMADIGVDPPERVYRPHVTVVRNARPFETQRLPQSAETEWSRFELLESITELGRTTYRPLVKEF
jgi:2'-5' RNA ligase